MNSTVALHFLNTSKHPQFCRSSNEIRDLESNTKFWTPRMVVDFIAGLFGGAAGVLVGHPFDTVKVHLQTDDPKNPKYKGTLHCFRTIIIRDKFLGLYRGISSPIAGIGLVNSIVFGVYGQVQRVTDNPKDLYSHFLAGSLAGLSQAVVCAPMELAKTRLQLAKTISTDVKFKGPLDCLRYIYRSEGIRGTFKGLTATILRDIPGFAGYFVSYEYIMQQTKNPSILYTLNAGGCAGMASWLCCYPIDVVKTRLQADALGKQAKYTGFLDCAVKCFKSEGILFFVRGLNSTLIRAFPMNAATFFVVQWVIDFSKNSGIDKVANSNQTLSVVTLDNTSEQYFHHGNPTEDERKVRKKITDNLLEFSSTRDI